MKNDSIHRQKTRVLLIDDKEDEFISLKNYLSKDEQYIISWEADYTKAKEKLLADDFDVFILDYRLGKFNGLELLSEVKGFCKYPIIFCIQSGDHETDKLALEYGAWSYLDKNESGIEILERTIRYATNRNRDVNLLNQLAYTDEITGIYNRRAFFDSLKYYISLSNRHHHPICLCLADLDKFKEINDTHGHLVGDKILKFFASNMKNLLRQEDIVGRYGGDEFAIILPYIELEQAIIGIDRVRSFFHENAFEHLDAKIFITGSFGIAQIGTADNGSKLLDKADKALYKAKISGRDNVSIFLDDEA